MTSPAKTVLILVLLQSSLSSKEFQLKIVMTENIQDLHERGENDINRRAGRPRKRVSKEHLLNLLQLKVPICGIARHLSVSRITIYIYMEEY
ncbi:uncharacterized protein LOC124439951 isoform X2 [Xenia sp. Carnegie-2017]|uniref:uncharacterized protein LOC124439951 isoform X2 n=1 Tax=Xenia sp. Carnegie-2017 TaxID=2897299 RepID=UPI001F034B20|nr:uncharacterized protein LOC124439951 isoform X2 [Xenia sp. Carnegie-2017]